VPPLPSFFHGRSHGENHHVQRPASAACAIHARRHGDIETLRAAAQPPCSPSPRVAGPVAGRPRNLSVGKPRDAAGSSQATRPPLLRVTKKDSPVNGTSAPVFQLMSDSSASGGAARASGAGFSTPRARFAGVFLASAQTAAQSIGGPRAGETGGGSSGSPRCVRIFRIGPGSVMKAMSRMSPPHPGHSSGNSSPTRAISLAQAIREVSCERSF
jgi:hypothetical protein